MHQNILVMSIIIGAVIFLGCLIRNKLKNKACSCCNCGCGGKHKKSNLPKPAKPDLH